MFFREVLLCFKYLHQTFLQDLGTVDTFLFNKFGHPGRKRDVFAYGSFTDWFEVYSLYGIMNLLKKIKRLETKCEKY